MHRIRKGEKKEEDREKREEVKKQKVEDRMLGRTAYSSLLHLRTHQTVPVRYEAFRSAQAPAEREGGKRVEISTEKVNFRTVVVMFLCAVRQRA